MEKKFIDFFGEELNIGDLVIVTFNSGKSEQRLRIVHITELQKSAFYSGLRIIYRDKRNLRKSECPYNVVKLTDKQELTTKFNKLPMNFPFR